MSISIKGYGENVLTFITNLTGAGMPVAITNGNTVIRTADDDDFIGITTYADGKIAGVIVDGYVEAPYTGAAPSFGFVSLVSNGENGVKTSTSSKHVVRVIKIDTQNNIVGFIL